MAEIQIFNDMASLARAAAEAIVAAAQPRIEARGQFSLGLSGGRTPEPLYHALASPELRAQINWTRVRVFFADERAVPPTHPESTYRLVRETLIDVVRIPPINVHRMKGDYPDLEAAVEEYEAHLTGPLDVLVLGVGEDGHTASIFPGSPLVEERTRRVALVTDAPKPPPLRLTVTGLVLREAHRVMVLATGTEKSAAVARALEGEVEPRELPARLLRNREWYLDPGAAARLERVG